MIVNSKTFAALASALLAMIDTASAAKCTNSGSFKIEGFSCMQIRNKEDRRAAYCKLASVSSSCPQACGLCCEDDPDFTFKNLMILLKTVNG